MPSPNPNASSFAASPVKLNAVQMLDSNKDEQIAKDSSVPSYSEHVIDSSEPHVSQVQVKEEPVEYGPEPNVSQVQVKDEPVEYGPEPHVSQVQVKEEPVQYGPLPDDPLALTSLKYTKMSAINKACGSTDCIKSIFSEPICYARKRHSYYADEISSMWNWRKIFERLDTTEQCIQFAEQRGLLPCEKVCSYHHKPMILRKDAGKVGLFRCLKSNCRIKPIDRAVGTWFENIQLEIPLVFQIMYAYSEGFSYHQVQKQLARENEPVLSLKTVADWYDYCRETLVAYELENQESQTKIGGPNKVVQIDQSKVDLTKYKTGQTFEVHWVLGMMEDGSNDLRLEVCLDSERSAEKVVPLIQKHVQEGSIIHTDNWEGYSSLSEHGYTHKSVTRNGSGHRFVALDGAHIQRIDSQWAGLKKALRQENIKMDFPEWLCEFSWRRKNRVNFRDPFEELIEAITFVYKI